MKGAEKKRDDIASAYSAQWFERLGRVWVSALKEHFEQVAGRRSNVLNWALPTDNVELATRLVNTPCFPEETLEARFSKLANIILARGQNLHHPRYVGHQVPASIPIAALFDAIGAATNQVMAIYEMGPWATAVERAMIDLLGAEIGYAPGSFSGICTSGGSLANLTALLTARNQLLSGSWTNGLACVSDSPALVVQNDVHYSVTRAAGVLGVGTNNIVRIPVDNCRKMDVQQLDNTLSSLRRKQRLVFAVVAGACATPIGAFDPLADIADVCQKHKVWLHVDAAHGGAALLSAQHRHLVAGLDRADSIVWDAHKMLFMPALCAFLFYREKSHRLAAFQQDASYLFDPLDPGLVEYDSGVQTLECTKRAAAFGLWGTWSLFGRQLFEDLINVTFARTQRFYEMLLDAEDFQPLHQPQCNIQVFRFVPPLMENWPIEQVGEFQLKLRRSVITSGEAYLVPITLDGVGALRMTLINPTTEELDLACILDILRAHANKMLD